MKKIAMLTGGGDCPGLNAVIRAVTRKELLEGYEVLGFRSGWGGVPKTIDNDIDGTDQTFGFDTAINIAAEAIDRLHSTAESHSRVLVVELMGRQGGWIGCEAGRAG